MNTAERLLDRFIRDMFSIQPGRVSNAHAT